MGPIEDIASRKKSDIWQYCTVLDSTHAKCSLCKQRLSYKSSITNIKRHLARKHPKVCQYMAGSRYQIGQIETIEIKPGTSDSENAFESYEENENVQEGNDGTYNIQGTAQLVATGRGTFHIVPKTAQEVIDSIESPEDNTETETMQSARKYKTSNIWQHCTAIDKVFAKCNICNAVLSYRTSITNIKKHLVRKHNFTYPTCQLIKLVKKAPSTQDDDEDEQASTSQMEVDEPECKLQTLVKQEPRGFLHSYSRKKDPAATNTKSRLDNKLLDLFIKDYHPFRIVEEAAFRSFVNSLNPSYVIPTKQQIVRSLTSTSGKCLTDMKQHALEIKECCLTTECWISEFNDNFLTVTVHFIDEEFRMKSILLECISVDATTNIARELQRVTEEWDLDQKISLAVSDNDVNVLMAMAELQWNHFGCFAQTIDSLIRDALTSVDPLLDKIKSVVAYFKTNTNASAELEVHQKNADPIVKAKKLFQENGRWISLLPMLERFIELEESIKEISLLHQDTDLSQLTSDEWVIIHELSQVLKPFETVANFISSEKYTCASLVIVLTKELDDALEEMLLNNYSSLTNEILTKLKTNLHEQLGNVETSETLALCTYLDPRFKNLGFSSNETADATKEHLIQLLSNRIIEQPTIVTSNQVKLVPSADSSFSIWQSFKKRVSECKQPSTSKSRAVLEVERYLEDELMDQHKNPLEWWREFKGIYPCMSVIAQEVMCALGTAIPSDRIFTKNGHALSLRRNCLSSEEVKILTFLNGNSELFRKNVYDS